MKTHLLINSITSFPFARRYSGVNEADSTVAFSNMILGESLEGIFHNWRDSAKFVFFVYFRGLSSDPAKWPTLASVVLKQLASFLTI